MHCVCTCTHLCVGAPFCVHKEGRRGYQISSQERESGRAMWDPHPSIHPQLLTICMQFCSNYMRSLWEWLECRGSSYVAIRESSFSYKQTSQEGCLKVTHAPVHNPLTTERKPNELIAHQGKLRWNHTCLLSETLG